MMRAAPFPWGAPGLHGAVAIVRLWLGCRAPRSLPARFRPRSLRAGGLVELYAMKCRPNPPIRIKEGPLHGIYCQHTLYAAGLSTNRKRIARRNEARTAC